MASLSAALEQIKDNPLGILARVNVEQACRDNDYRWRERRLDPATTLALFVQQILHANAPCSEVRHLAGQSFSPQAYCQARARLPLSVYQSLLMELAEQVNASCSDATHRWHGHRTFHIDGSTFSMPDTPQLQKAFGMPSGQKEGCGFPVAHLLVLFSAATGLLIDTWASPLYTGDVAETLEAHLHLQAGDILIGDDSYSGYRHLASLQRRQLHGLFPVHHLRIVSFQKNRPHCGEGKAAVAKMPRSRWIKSLGKEDQLVEYFKPKQKPMWMAQSDWDALPASITVRELRRTVVRPGLGKITLTLVTTLLDAKKYPPQDLLELRLRRWDVETNLRHLKTTMGLDVLHCKSEAGVRKELAVFSIVYNLVRLVMLEAADRQQVAVSRISFADAYKWMRHARPADELPTLIVNPSRPNRIEPRCKNRRAKQYDLMNKPRAQLRKLLKNKRKKA
jgi:DDE family transposase